MNLGTKEEYIAKFRDCHNFNSEEHGRNWEHLAKATKGKDVSKIPRGCYCYTLLSTKNQYGMPNIEPCPYLISKDINSVQISYCDYLEWGDCGDITEYEYEKLIEHFGSEEKMREVLPLFLLFDMCKECGENDEDGDYYGDSSQKES